MRSETTFSLIVSATQSAFASRTLPVAEVIARGLAAGAAASLVLAVTIQTVRPTLLVQLAGLVTATIAVLTAPEPPCFRRRST